MEELKNILLTFVFVVAILFVGDVASMLTDIKINDIHTGIIYALLVRVIIDQSKDRLCKNT